MPALLVLDHVACRTPDGRDLFQDLSLSIGAGLTGLVGGNGAGKTTLLRLISGEIEPFSGAIRRLGRVALLRQDLAPDPGISVADHVGLGEDLARLARIAEGDARPGDLEAADWTVAEDLRAALEEVGLDGLDVSRPAASLSGGEATRAALAALMARKPDLLLLDEPTNNLDADARAFVSAALVRWRGAAVVASHDRVLLEAMDRILELSELGPRVFGGGYSLYAARQAEAEDAARRELADARKDVTRVRRETQAAREGKARRDRQGARHAASGSMPKMAADARAERAQATSGGDARLAERKAREAALALEIAERRVARAAALAFELPPSRLPQGRLVLALENAAFAWQGQEHLFGPLTLSLTGPARLAVRGPNGSGKTSLLRLILGELTPTTGMVRLGVPAAYLDQRAALLRPGETLLEAFLRLDPEATPHLAHAALARFLFRASAAQRRVETLSGGERLRAALACVLMGTRPPQLLVLDEPTNHLDLASLEAVEAALRGYDGALIVVSHDESFLEAVGMTQALDLR